MKLVLLLVALLTLGGCATSEYSTVVRGGSVYEYSKGADGSCKLSATTVRDVAGGKIAVDENCALSAEAEGIVSPDTNISDLIEIISK